MNIFENCEEVFYGDNKMTLVLVVVKYKFFVDMVLITRTSRKCFRVERSGVMKSFLSYKDAVTYVVELVKDILIAKERRDNYGEIFMQKLREEALNRCKKS